MTGHNLNLLSQPFAGEDCGDALEAMLAAADSTPGVSWRVGVIPSYQEGDDPNAALASGRRLKAMLTRGRPKPAIMQV